MYNDQKFLMFEVAAVFLGSVGFTLGQICGLSKL